MPGQAPLDRRRRRGRVLDIVARAEFVGVDELTRELAVSRGTIQADLRDLEAAGRLRRVWGGAKPVERARPAVDQVSSMAAALVRPKDAVLLACGEASAGIAAALVEQADLVDLTVITGDPAACERFADHLDRFTVRLTGGVLERGTLVPPRDTDRRRDPVDVAMLGCHRVDAAGQVHLTAAQRAAATALASVDARRTVLVSTGDVTTSAGGEPWLSIGDVDALITSAAGNRTALDRLRAGGAQILVAT